MIVKNKKNINRYYNKQIVNLTLKIIVRDIRGVAIK